MENPRVIMVTNEDDALGAKYEKNYPNIREKDIDVLFPDQITSNYPDITFKGGKPSPNTVFVQHPFFNNFYIDIENSQETIEKDKMKSFFEICQFLGISRIEEETKISSYSGTNQEGNVKGSKAGVEGEINVSKNNEVSQGVERKIIMKFKDSGQINYQEARRRAEEKNLSEDHEIMSVIDFCNPENLNTLEEYKIVLTTSNEANNLFKIAGNLSIMKGVLNISADYQSKCEERHETSKTLYLKFN